MSTQIVCKKNRDGSREHSMSVKVDFLDRQYESCDRCGAFIVSPEKANVLKVPECDVSALYRF